MSKNSENSVLVVDDAPEQIRYVSEQLKGEGCRVFAATSWKDAEKLLKKHAPDLIILDIVMPGMDGYQFCRQLKENPETVDIPVIFATAYHDSQSIGNCFEAGGCDYLIKPFIREELLERVKVRIRISQKRRQLQKAYAELDKFCYTVSHDIRAPLSVICQLTDLMEQTAETGDMEELKKIGEMLREKSEQAARMTEGLHRFSKIFYENLNCVEVDMSRMVRELYEELSLLESGREIVFEEETLPMVHADPVLIRLAFQNILSNALKFTRIRNIARITVSGEKKSGSVIYRITDNGIGFDQKYSSELFQVFRRLHVQEEYEGDGIGLATVKRIITRHGGEVTISSDPGEGSCVTIRLPE